MEQEMATRAVPSFPAEQDRRWGVADVISIDRGRSAAAEPEREVASASVLEPESMVARVSRIMATVNECEGPVCNAEISRRTQLSHSKVSRTVKELVAHGMLERRGSGVVVGVKIFELGAGVPRLHLLRQLVVPVVVELRRVTGHTVQVAILDGHDVVFIEVLPGRDENPHLVRAGRRAPAHASGVGKALLAHFPEEWVELFLREHEERSGPRAAVATQNLRQELQSVRSAGWATEGKDSDAGVSSVASPILRVTGLPLAAIGVSGSSGRISPTRTAPIVQTAATELTRRVRTDPRLRLL